MWLARGGLDGEAVEIMAPDRLTKRDVLRSRNRAIVRMHRQNRSLREISIFFNLHKATVCRILDTVPESARERDDAIFAVV
jgi:hypothetical protein